MGNDDGTPIGAAMAVVVVDDRQVGRVVDDRQVARGLSTVLDEASLRPQGEVGEGNGRSPSTQVQVVVVAAGSNGGPTRDEVAAWVLEMLHPLTSGGPLPASSPFEEAPPLVAPLTKREQEVLDALGRGRPPTVIARSLCLSEHTVRNHVRHILAKLGAHSQLEAVAVAARAGLLDLGDAGRRWTA